MNPDSLLESMDLAVARANTNFGGELAVIESGRVYLYFNVAERLYLIKIGAHVYMISFHENSTKSEVVTKYINHDLGSEDRDVEKVINKFNDLLPTINSIIGDDYTRWLRDVEGIKPFWFDRT